MKKPAPTPFSTSRKRMALYARVSTEEQTKGNYPSCDSQVEELEAACRAKGWEPYRVVKDEGISAGTLNRSGIAEIRWMVQNNEIDGVLCTWYDRLTRSRDFYVLDKEFRAHNVEFITLHDPTDTTTAAGRFMESMLVAAKTYERDQTAEKVRTKMRMRLEKGMHNGGITPFGFTVDPTTKMLSPEPEQAKIVEQMFRVYTETNSDFMVRDWLRAHQINAPHGDPIWQVGTLRDLLCNRRYIGEIEINKSNKGIEGLQEGDSYHVVKAPHEPMVPIEVFELAQTIRRQKASKHPNHGGKSRSFRQAKCERVYLLQGIMTCGVCGHAMAAHYVYHKQGVGRTRDSYIAYYVCAQQVKNWKRLDHKNHILARRPEAWMLERIRDLVESDYTIERAVERAQMRAEADLQPVREALSATRRAAQENQAKIDEVIQSISSGQARGALVELLNERAQELKQERELLRNEQRRLQEELSPLDERFDTAEMRNALSRFSELAPEAEPQELQRLLRLSVRNIEWMPDGTHRVQYYQVPKPKNGSGGSSDKGSGPGKDGFYTGMWSGGPERRTYEPLIYRFRFLLDSLIPKLEIFHLSAKGGV